MIDIVIFATLAVFIVYKLRKMLGEEYESPSSAAPHNNVKEVYGQETDVASHNETQSKIKKALSAALGKNRPATLETNIEEIEKHILALHPSLSLEARQELLKFYRSIPGFTCENFLFDAQHIFETIIEAYSHGDALTIIANSRTPVAENFVRLMEEKKADHKKEIVAILKIEDIKLLNTYSDSQTSYIEVLFNSIQISYIENTLTKEIIEGSKSARHKASEKWLFFRDHSSQSSNWLVANIEICEIH